MKIAVRRGHQRTGADGCAVGILNEIDVANAYYSLVMAKLKALGHQVLDVTPPEANRSLQDSLWYGINKANNWGADLFVSCHANNAYNSYNGVIGCEVLYHRNSAKGREYATKVEREIANIGFKSRGAKIDVRNLAEINGTNCPCIIIEPFFLEATGDVANYRRVGAEGLANAIVKGLVGQTVATSTPKREIKKIVKYDENIPTGDNIFRIPNTTGYIEQASDGRLILHKDRGNYICIGQGFINLYWNDNNGKNGSKRISE